MPLIYIFFITRMATFFFSHGGSQRITDSLSSHGESRMATEKLAEL